MIDITITTIRLAQRGARPGYEAHRYGNTSGMSIAKPDDERTATDELIEANREPAPVAPATRDVNATEPGGLPPGQTDDTRSPLDPAFYDPKHSDET